MTISDEAVQAAATAFLSESIKRKGELGASSMALLAALEAAAPHLMSAAWDEGYRGCYERYMYEPVPVNPYRHTGAGE